MIVSFQEVDEPHEEFQFEVEAIPRRGDDVLIATTGKLYQVVKVDHRIGTVIGHQITVLIWER